MWFNMRSMTNDEFQGYVVAKLEGVEKQLDDLSDRVYNLAAGISQIKKGGLGGALSTLCSLISKPL